MALISSDFFVRLLALLLRMRRVAVTTSLYYLHATSPSQPDPTSRLAAVLPSFDTQNRLVLSYLITIKLQLAVQIEFHLNRNS